MSLFSSSGSNSLFGSKKPFENLVFANEHRAICQKHLQDLNSLHFRRGLFFGIESNIAACSQCKPPGDNYGSCLADFQEDSKNQCWVISPKVSQISPELAPTVQNPSLDLEHIASEHILWDISSEGYDLRSLVYMKDQKVLAACSRNGSICFWSLGEKVELKEPKVNLEKKINFAKYYVMSEDNKYLAIGTDKGVHVYHIAAGDISSIRLLGVIDEEKVVSDLDFLESERQIVTVYDERVAKIWSLDTLKMEKIVDLNQYSIEGNIVTVIYLKRTGELAIEHEQGLSVIKDWQQNAGHVRHHLVGLKNGFGCMYLPNTRRFILNHNLLDAVILQEEDFAKIEKYALSSLFQSRGNEYSLKRFIASQDESMIISNGKTSQLNSFEKKTVKIHGLDNFIWGTSDVELIEDQYRIAVANPQKGTVTIFRMNANVNIERGEGLPPLPAVQKAQDRPTFGGGGLFSGGGSGGGLFSRNSAPSSRNPPPRVNNTSLFSGNTSKKSTKPKPKQTSKPAKKGKKIQKIQVHSVAAAKKKKEKSAPLSAKKGKRALKAESSKSQNKNLTEAVRIRGKKKTKKEEEKVWVVLPSAADDEKKRGRSLNKKKTEETKTNKTKRKADISEDRSRSRSKSKSVTRKK